MLGEMELFYLLFYLFQLTDRTNDIPTIVSNKSSGNGITTSNKLQMCYCFHLLTLLYLISLKNACIYSIMVEWQVIFTHQSNVLNI